MEHDRPVREIEIVALGEILQAVLEAEDPDAFIGSANGPDGEATVDARVNLGRVALLFLRATISFRESAESPKAQK